MSLFWYRRHGLIEVAALTTHGIIHCQQHWLVFLLALALRALILSVLGSLADGREISGGGFDIGSVGVFSHSWRLLHWLGFIIVAINISGVWR